MQEKSIVKQLNEGSSEAFTMLYKRYSSQAFSLAYKYLGNTSLAEDVVQNLFLCIWNIREQIDPDKPFNHFLFTILKNDILNVLRNGRNSLVALDECLEVLYYIENPEDDTAELDEQQIIIFKKALEQLSPQRRKIFSLKIYDRLSNQEIAEKLNLSVNTIKFQYSQSLKILRKYASESTLTILLIILSNR